MKKCCLFIFIIASFMYPTISNAFYSPDLEAVYQTLKKECQDVAHNDAKYFPNPIDSSTFFQCYNGDALLGPCPPSGFDVQGVIFPYFMFIPTTETCDWGWHDTLDQVQEMHAQGTYRGRCTESTVCDCRDNPRESNLSGSCKCAVIPQFGYGLQMDYSTCVAAPKCASMTDTGGINRATYDPTSSACYVPTGYTFGNSTGHYQFTSNCFYSN